MTKRLLCLLLALLCTLMLVACNKEPVDGDQSGDPNAGGGGGSGVTDTTSTEHYLPEDLFAEVKKAFSKGSVIDFPSLNYENAPFAISDDAFAGKHITSISLPVRDTGAADADGKLKFTLYVMPNTYDALVDSRKTGVVEHEIKIDPAAHGIEAGKKLQWKYITVDLTSYQLKLTNEQTLAFGAKGDTILIASMATRQTASGGANVIKQWRKEFLTTGYHANIFSGKVSQSEGGIYFSRDSLPIDMVFDYGTPEAKKAVVDARKAAEDAYNAKLEAVARAYKGKYLSLMGDSISSFRGVTDNTEYSTALNLNRCYYGASYMNDYTQMYWGRLAYECDMELCVINGWSSSKVYGGGKDKNDQVDATRDNMLVRSTTLHNNEGQKPDVILLYMGINDVNSKHWSNLYELLSVPGRTKTDAQIVEEWLVGVHETYNDNKGDIIPGKTYTSWEASYALSLERMQHNYKDAEIYIINLIRSHHGSGSKENINKANTCLAALAAYYGVDVIDQGQSEVNYENCHLYGADEANPTALHPNLRGHAAMTRLIVEKLYEKLPKS